MEYYFKIQLGREDGSKTWVEDPFGNLSSDIDFIRRLAVEASQSVDYATGKWMVVGTKPMRKSRVVDSGDSNADGFRPCIEVEVIDGPKLTKRKQFIATDDRHVFCESKSQAVEVAKREARKHGTGRWEVVEVTRGTVQVPVGVVESGDVNVEDRIIELAESYDVPVDVVEMLYDMMPNELYDGIPIALEDM